MNYCDVYVFCLCLSISLTASLVILAGLIGTDMLRQPKASTTLNAKKPWY